jgi:trimethylamine---corrinoid protein Co-methyltransferase
MRRGTKVAAHSGGVSLSMFTEADLDDLHAATVQILDQTGVLVESDDALDIFADGGCRVNRDTHIVQIPPEVLHHALTSARSSFLLAGRDSKDDLMIEVGRVTCVPFAEGLMVNDLETGEHRESRKEDVATICRLADALPELDQAAVSVIARDVPAETAAVHNFEAALPSTTKPFNMSMTTSYEAEICIDMAAAIAGGRDKLRERPFVFFGSCPVAPMNLCVTLTDALIPVVRAGLPFLCISMGMAGASTPVTLAGTLVVQNTELLATYVLSQLVNRGNPFIYGNSTCTMDMRWGASAVGTPETALYQAGTVALATYYGLPSWTAGY